MVDWQNAGRIAGKAWNVGSNVIGVPFDYMAGKAEGEDDFRAGAGAVASGLGGWKGALAGAGIGAAFGPAGALAGGIIGGMAGSFAGGWTADRVDEFVRGKNTGRNNIGARNNMSQAVRLENGDVVEVDDNGNFIGWLVKGGIVLAGGEALYGAGRNAYEEIARQRQASNIGLGMGNRPFNSANAINNAKAVGSQALEGAVNSRAGQMVRALPTWGKVAAGALIADQLTGGNLAKGVGRVLGGGADMIANTVGFNTDFDGQNQMSQQAMKEDREQQRIEQNRRIYNAYDDEMYKRYRMMSEDAFNRENAIWNRNKDEAWRVADKADEVSRRNYLTNFTANQANALLQGYMNDIPRSVNDSLKTVFSARYN
jgi:hypothetical protein